MIYKPENLDTPINELEPLASNKQTPREYIRQSEEEFGLEPADIDNMNETQLEDYMDELDYLWDK